MKFMELEPYAIKQTLIVGCLNLIEVVNGCGVAWSAPVIQKLTDVAQSPLSHAISSSQISWVVSLIYFGIVGAYIGSYAANKFGRRLCLIFWGILTIFAYALLIASSNLNMIYCGRILVGMSVSFSFVITMLYIGEISSADIRGKLLSSTGFFHAFGCLLMYCVGPYVSYIGTGCLALTITGVYTVFSFYLPESPVYYALKGNEDAAKASLIYLGRSKDIDVELKLIMENIKETEKNSYIWRQIFTVKGNLKSILVTVPLFLFQQSSGIISVIFFATTIFKDAGSSIKPEIATMIIGITMVIGTIFSPMFVEKYGRKILLIISTIGCCISLTALGLYFYFKKIDNPSVVSLGWFPLVSLIAALFSYSVGINVIPNVLSSEMFAPNIRGVGSSISITTGWMSGLISTNIFSYTVTALGSDVGFWIFAAVDALALMFVISFVPETKGKTLMEINSMMAK